jgi:hypothetical protein
MAGATDVWGLEPVSRARGYGGMLDFPIDPELRVRASPEQVLRRTNEALKIVRTMTLSRPGHQWQDVLRSFEAIRDEWSAMEAVVNLELLLEAEGLLIEEKGSQPSLPISPLDRTPPGSRFPR